MKKVLIGSRAAKHWLPDFRKTNDYDYLVDGEIPHEKDIEYYNCNKGEGFRKIWENSDEIAIVDVLYTIKLAHSFWDIHWHKTMYDIKFFQEKGIIHLPDLFEQLYKDCIEIHGSKKASLKKSNAAFFQDSVDRIYVHDDLHKAVAYYDRPLYDYVKKDRSKAFIDYDMFLKLSREDQLRLCREEIYVTALERFMIPRNFQISRLTAYRGACRKLVTSMTKGWFPRFIVFNWKELNRPDDHDFVGIFKEKENQLRHADMLSRD